MIAENVILTINGTNVRYIPSTWAESENDVSAPNAGRDEAGLMHKQKLGSSSKYELSYKNVDNDTVHFLANLVKVGEYITVGLVDIIDGDPSNNYVIEKVCYVGDREMELYNSTKGIWSKLAFNLIERGIH